MCCQNHLFTIKNLVTFLFFPFFLSYTTYIMSAKLKQLLKRSAVLLEPQDRESLPIVGKDAEQLLKHFAAQSERIQASKEQQAKAYIHVHIHKEKLLIYNI